MSMTLEPCKECGSTDVSWSCAPVNNGQAVDGRVCMREVGMRFYRGCGFCGETLEVIDADDFLGKLNAHLSRQSDGPSEEDVERAHKAYWETPDNHKGDDRPAMRAALTAVWHNRPAQDQHPDDIAVDAFADAMKAKLAEARRKGRSGWQDKTDCPQQRLSNMLRDHVEKGDPRDVANFCMFLHQRGESILPKSRTMMELAAELLPKQEAQEKCTTCDDTGDIHDATGEWRGECPYCQQAQEKATNYVSGRVDSTGKFHATAQEKAEPVAETGRLYVEARQCEDCDHLGINDSSDTVSACGDCEWQGPTPDEDKCPGCARHNCMAVACPICGGRYRFLADRWFTQDTAPPAKRVRVPDALAENAVIFGDADDDGYRMGWNACRAAMLSAAPEADHD